MSAAFALRAAMRAALAADAALLALLGAAIHDEVPRSAEPPYLVLADHLGRDASTGTETAEEHEIALHVWSAQGGLREALEIAETAISALLAAELSPAGHRLVNFAWLSTDARREDDGRHRFAVVRFRALTEPV